MTGKCRLDKQVLQLQGLVLDSRIKVNYTVYNNTFNNCRIEALLQEFIKSSTCLFFVFVIILLFRHALRNDWLDLHI